jgi:acyl-CoA thioester hydrolase
MSYETDYQGFVNNTEFIRFLEKVRYAMSKKIGFSYQQSRASKLWTVMAHVEINYRSPAYFEDIMIGTGWVSKVGNTSLRIFYEFRLKGTGRLVADAEQVMVFVDQKLKPQPVPPVVRRKLSRGTSKP